MIHLFLDNLNTAPGLDDDYANLKCSSMSTKRNKTDDLIHATIGLAIVAIFIIVIYLYTHLREKY